MKKVLSFVFGLMLSLSVLLIGFLPAKNQTQKNADAASSVEQRLYDDSTLELVSKTPPLVSGASADKTPFDIEAGARMEGASLTPTADIYGQVENFSVSLCNGAGFVANDDDNILMWLYLIDAQTFRLEISLKGVNSNTLVWKFDFQEVYNMGFGWKLISLKLNDKSSLFESGVSRYETITFKYDSVISELEGQEGYESYDVVTDERFSLYHIFTSKNANLIKKSGFLYGLPKAFYKFSENFNIGSTVYIGDKLKINAPSSIFEYLCIGKKDLSDFLNNGKYFWKIFLTTPSQTETYVDFGENINFHEQGFYYIGIRLIEDKESEDEILLNAGFNVYSEDLQLGEFEMGSSFSIKDDETIIVKLKLSSALTNIENIEVKLNNNKAEIETYYEEDGYIYVFVAGRGNGKLELEISADAKSKLGDSAQTFSSVASIEVEYDDGEIGLFMLIIWISFGCFCAGIIIYMTISVVNARKNDVK